MSNDLIVKALIALGHNSGWALTGETLDGLVFDDETKKPTAKRTCRCGVRMLETASFLVNLRLSALSEGFRLTATG